MEDKKVPVNADMERSFPIWRILYRNLILMLVVIFVCGCVGITLGYTVAEDRYTASTDIILKASFEYENGGSTTDELNNNTLAKKTLPTIVEDIKSPIIIEKIKSTYFANEKGKTISASNISTSYDDESLIFRVSYTDTTAKDAALRLFLLIDTVQKEQAETNANESVFPGVSKIEFVEVLSPVNGNDLTKKYNVSVSNSRTKYIILGFLGGGILAVCSALLVYVLDNKVKDVDELEEISNASLLAVIDD